MPWKYGFPEQEGGEAYRSRARAKRRKEQEDTRKLQALEKRQHALEALVQQLKQQHEEMRPQGATHQLQLDPAEQGSQRKSNVASMAAAATDDEAPMDPFPVDNIKEKTNCDLHVRVKNISLKVATGYALPYEPGALWHCKPIPAGYARVGVDEILPGYASLELDFTGPEDEKTLGEVGGGIILWLKEDIKFPGLVPNPPPLRGNSAPPSPPPHDGDDHHNTSSSRSPPTRQPSPPPRQPSLPPLPTTKSQGQKSRKRGTAS